MENQDKNIIVFDNLVQSAGGEFVGEIQPVKAKISEGEYFRQPNAKGELYQPTSLEDVAQRACDAGEQFLALFQK